jgi:hypothetical protein
VQQARSHSFFIKGNLIVRTDKVWPLPVAGRTRRAPLSHRSSRFPVVVETVRCRQSYIMTVAEKEAMTLYARVLALAAALALSAAHAEAQDKTLELRLSHFLPPTHPVHKALEDWGRSIEKASNGTIEYKIYPA